MGLFGKKKAVAVTSSAALEMGNAPLTAYEQAKTRFFEIYGSSKVESARWFVAAVVLGVIVVVLGLAIRQMAPLKSVVPYMVAVDEKSGAVATAVAAQNFKPDRTIKSYFLSKWVEMTLTLDPYLTQKYIRSAYSLTRDKAIQEFTELLQRDKPVESLYKDPSLIRTVHIISINPGDDGIAFVNYKTAKRSGSNGASEEKRYMMTIHYAIIPPQDEAEIRANPIGMYITHFVISEELNN